MKAVLVALYLVYGSPGVFVTKVVEFESMVACEIQEGALNLPVTRGMRPDDYDDNSFMVDGWRLSFYKAECEPMGQEL